MWYGHEKLITTTRHLLAFCALDVFSLSENTVSSLLAVWSAVHFRLQTNCILNAV